MTKSQVKSLISRADTHIYRAEILVTNILLEIQKHTDVDLYIQNVPGHGWCFSYIYTDEFGIAFDCLAPVEFVFDLYKQKNFLTQEDFKSVSI